VSDQDRLRLAVFIDFDNIEIGVKNTLGTSFDAGLVLEALKERGEVVSKTAYSDWQRAGGYSRALTQHAIKMVQRNLTPGGDKNGADINLALDALEMAFTHSHINAFVIVGGDSDFISLVEKLKQYDKKVFIVGGRQFTSGILQRNCHEFIAYENLAGAGSSGRRHVGREAPSARASASIEQAIPLVDRALKVLLERDVSPQLGLLKSTLLQLDSTFSERSYGAGSFRDFAQKLEKAGVIRVHQGKGGWLVGPPDGQPVSAERASHGHGDEAVDRQAPAAAESPAAASDGRGRHRAPEPVEPAGGVADGLAEFRRILGAAVVRRWPMYLRNVKQLLRQAAPPFDERAFGFGSLVDLLRAAQKEGLVRVERDRQGVIRVFQGATMPAAGPAVHEGLPRDDEDEIEEPREDVQTSAVEEPAYQPAAESEDAAETDSASEADARASSEDGEAPASTRKRPARRRKPAGAKPAAAATPRTPRTRRARR
jgi:uncharacterized LabA/DUF88 family protein